MSTAFKISVNLLILQYQLQAERRLSPDYNAYEKALQCTTKTHRCLHAAHAYTGIPCAAYSKPMLSPLSGSLRAWKMAPVGQRVVTVSFFFICFCCFCFFFCFSAAFWVGQADGANSRNSKAKGLKGKGRRQH